MGIEIERKFLLRNDDWRHEIERSERIAQGYLVGAQALHSGAAKASVRARISGEQAWLNIKAATPGIARAEFDYAIPSADAQVLLATLCDRVMEKLRHHVRVDGMLFEIDEFLGDNAGLTVAEIELVAVDASFPRPPWLGAEVSALGRYYNVHLIDHPYCAWSPEERAAGDTPC